MATPSGKAIDAAYLKEQLKNYDTQVATVKYNEKFQLKTMPSAEEKYKDKYIQYVGETTDDYIKGYFYTCVENTEDSTYSWIPVTQSAPDYTIKKLDEATEGYAATYSLVKDDKEIGAKIDIPKDFFVSDASTGVVTAIDKAEGGKFYENDNFVEGDTYIELDVSLKDKTEPKPVYINVSSLVDIYKAGDGIEVDADINKISAKLAEDGGLKFAELAEGETEKGVAIDFETENIDFENDWEN